MSSLYLQLYIAEASNTRKQESICFLLWSWRGWECLWVPYFCV